MPLTSPGFQFQIILMRLLLLSWLIHLQDRDLMFFNNRGRRIIKETLACDDQEDEPAAEDSHAESLENSL